VSIFLSCLDGLCSATRCLWGHPQDFKGEALLIPVEERYRTVGRGRCGCYEKFCPVLQPSVKVTLGAIKCIVSRMRVTYVVILGPSSESLEFWVFFSSGWFQGWKAVSLIQGTAFCIECSLKGRSFIAKMKCQRSTPRSYRCLICLLWVLNS